MTGLQIHTIPPCYHRDSKVLILGTFPSPKSRAFGFYYGHPRNRFWGVLAEIFQEDLPMTIEEKKTLLMKHHIALWDVLAACKIRGASDSSITDPVPNDIVWLINRTEIRRIYTTGRKATDLYRKLSYPKTGIESIMLPSTSPANAAFSQADLVSAYQEILFDLQG